MKRTLLTSAAIADVQTVVPRILSGHQCHLGLSYAYSALEFIDLCHLISQRSVPTIFGRTQSPSVLLLFHPKMTPSLFSIADQVS